MKFARAGSLLLIGLVFSTRPVSTPSSPRTERHHSPIQRCWAGSPLRLGSPEPVGTETVKLCLVLYRFHNATENPIMNHLGNGKPLRK